MATSPPKTSQKRLKNVSKTSQKSEDVIKRKIAELRHIIPECFSEESLDVEKLRRILGQTQTLDPDDEKYTLGWAGKNDTFRIIQNPATGTLVPDKNESINFDDTENIFIEGENLMVLKLLQKS